MSEKAKRRNYLAEGKAAVRAEAKAGKRFGGESTDPPSRGASEGRPSALGASEGRPSALGASEGRPSALGASEGAGRGDGVSVTLSCGGMSVTLDAAEAAAAEAAARIDRLMEAQTGMSVSQKEVPHAGRMSAQTGMSVSPKEGAPDCAGAASARQSTVFGVVPRKVTRVKGVRGGVVTVEWETEQGGVTVEHKLVCVEEARPEFYGALDALAETAVRVCWMGWPNCGRDGVHVLGVGFKHGDDWLGATMTAFWAVSGKKKVLLNTPFVTDRDAVLKTAEWDLLYQVELEALAYLDGARAQAELPLGGG